MPVQIQFRRGTAAQWTSANPTLAEGELGLETDTSLIKIGDGDTPWNSLAYAVINGTVPDGFITESKLATSAVTNTKIANNAVSQTKLASDLSGVTICTSTTRPGSPFTGQTIYETNTVLFRTWNGASWVTIGPATPTAQYPDLAAYGVATGGTSSSITVNSINYTLLTFTSDATLTVSTAGWFDFIMVGGGGAGGPGNNTSVWSYGNLAGCGGGGGEVIFASRHLTTGTYSVVIGTGGSSAYSGSATFIAKTGIGATGGTGGGGAFGYPYFPVRSGGCGAGSMISGSSGIGYPGIATVSATQGSGGGGAGGAASGATGGAGFDISIWVGGGANLKGAGGTGGAGGAGGSAGAANSGNGGNGAGYGSGSSAGGSGGSGIAYVRFRV